MTVFAEFAGKPVDIEKLRSVSVSKVATPSRGGRVPMLVDRERQWETDHAAYRRMRREGLQPKVLDGAAELEKRAETRLDVEGVKW